MPHSLEHQSQTKKKGTRSTTKHVVETKEHDGDDSSSSDSSQESVHRFVEPPPTDPMKQEYIDAVGGPGQLFCFLQVYDNEPVFGILASEVHEARILGSCIMSDGQYQTFSCYMLGVAAVTCAKDPYTNLCPRKQLQVLARRRLKDKRAMLHDIALVESDFKIRMKRAAQKQAAAAATLYSI